MRSSRGNATVTFEALGHRLTNVSVVDNAPAYADGNSLPLGLFAFEVYDVAPGGAATVRMFLPAGITPTGYYKDNPTTGALERFDFDGRTGAVIDGNIITLHLVDGGRGDADGVANGVIVDPGGPSTGAPIFVVGPDAGSEPRVKVYDAVTQKLMFDFLAYNKSFAGGVRVAVGDVNADGYSDIITGAGPGGGSQVRVFNGKNGNLAASFNAFASGFTNGVFVAAGDVSGDGKADIIVGSEQGSAAKVRAFSGVDGSLLFELAPMDYGFTGGVRVASGDVNGDGRADIIAAAGPGGSPRVCVYDGKTRQVFYDFLGADPTDKGGMYVTAGDVDADGKADIVVGSGSGREARIFRASDNATTLRSEVFAAPFSGGVRVAVGDFNGDGRNDLASATGPGDGLVRVVDPRTSEELATGEPYGATFSKGVFIAATTGLDDGGFGTLSSNPAVTIEATTPATIENSGTSAVFTLTRSGDTSKTLYVLMSYGGTASGGGSDYSSLPAAVFIFSGQTTATINVSPVNDANVEYLETVVATIQPYMQPYPPYDVGTPSSAVVSIIDDDGPPPTPPEADCGCGGELPQTQGGVGGNLSSAVGAGGVRLFDGAAKVGRHDLDSAGFGAPWGFDWSWTNSGGYAAKTVAGKGSVVSQLPYITKDGINTLSVISSCTTARTFDGSTPRFFGKETLSENTTNKEYTLTDTTGNVLKFHNFDTSLPAEQRGQLKSFTDAAGNVTTVTAYTTEGRPSEVQRSSTVGSTTITESYLYTYLTSGDNAGRISNATLRRQVNGGSWSTVRQVDLSYYGTSDSNGTLGDLKTAIVKDGSGTTLDTGYYRYYTSSSSTGYAGAMKYAFSAESYDRLVAVYSNPDTATDAQVAPYADVNYEYDSVKRVTKAVVQGDGCSACSGGLGTYTYSYTVSAFADGYNNWRMKTVETLPDGNQNIAYTNFAGETILHVYKDVTSGNTWKTWHKFDSSGRRIQTAAPSAISGYDETKADLLDNNAGNYTHLRDSTGLIENFAYASTTTATSTTAGDVAGYQSQSGIQRGETGSAILQFSQQYFSRTGGSITIYPTANTTQYRNTDGTGGQTTNYSYTWQGSTTQAESITTTLPTVTTAQNGPNSADVSIQYFDTYGRPTWSKDADGFINYMEYDQATGGVTKTIVDVDTDVTSDFSGLPSGWSNPSGLHLKSLFEVDSLGRTTKATDPNGNIDYTVYLDSNHEVRLYRGWDTGTNLPTGPTVVSREDRPGSYTETLTMSATPNLTSGRPNGTESISSLQTLSRSYTNSAGQVTHSDVYFSLSGLTYSTSTSLGTENTHFYRTEYQWDDYGQIKRTLSPTDTIYRTVRDGQGRPVSEWIGLDDTPTSGFWSPTNTAGTDLVKVREYEYDSGGVGDGLLTKTTDIPGGGAANRVTTYHHDWRNRTVAVKSGVETTESTSVNRPIFYVEMDNLGQVIASEMYDGDTVSISDGNSDGVPDKPSSSLRRARSESSFDEQGRVYQSKVFSVDPSSGSVSTNALASNTWFDHRGNVIKSSAPGGLVMKYQYDGAGRTTKSFVADGGGDSGWSDADDVTGDIVLSQAETQYDAAGNAILVITKDRFHDETATGELGNATSAPKARVSYSASYYDKAHRITDSVTVGTNGGSAWTRPSTASSRSDTVLVTSLAYNAAGWTETVTDPRGLLAKTYYDNLGRTIKTIEAYVDGTPSNADDKTVEYTYDGSGHMLTLKAHLTGGAYEETKWVYGTNTSTSDVLNSNDLLKKVQHPDASTGNASASEQETHTVSALGQMVTTTDRNGNVHGLTYDVLGRLTSDAVTTLGSGVDGSVRRIEIAYDGQGNAYKLTSYDAATGGNIVNEIQREFNGLGQMTKEYQEHGGAVNTGTSLKVQYAWSEMTGGANHSRLTKITYPNGKELNFNYSSGLNDGISRLSSLSDSTGTLESYDYLGLGIVVRRSHSQPGVDLTFIKQTGESNGDAGDQYIGLDRFCRTADQRWIKTSSGTATDRFQYGHDRNGNRLYRDNLLDNNFDELYHANGAANGYDALNQLTDFRRGALSDTNSDTIPDTVTTASRTQGWAFDALGNFSTQTTDGTGQTRSHNMQNEITSISGATTPTYDANGNLTKDETGRTLEYDAWNRLVRVKNSGGSTLVSYKYDAANRRAQQTASSTTTDFYLSDQWQVLEERVSGAAKVQYIWSPVYVDAMILRDRDAAGDSALEERLWVQQDANFNVTALLDNSGNVVERFAYDPYGTPNYFDANWGTRSASSYAWVHLHQGGKWETLTGLYHFRNREYSPTLGRWVGLDPIRFQARDSNFYRYLSNSASNGLDPIGLEEVVGRPKPGWTPGYGMSGLDIARVTHRLDCIDQAKPAVDAIIDRDIYGVACPIAKVKAAVHRLMELASFLWRETVGPFGKCCEWVDKYNKMVGPLLDQLNREGLLGCCIRVGGMTAANAFSPQAILSAGHCFVRIEVFGSYGSQVIYLDDGNWGGNDHVFVYDEIPWWYGPGGWVQSSTSYSEWGPIPTKPHCRRRPPAGF